MSGPDLLVATRSSGKLRELLPMFAAAGLRVTDLESAGIEEHPDEDALEQFPSFEENALAKARHFRRLASRPVVADDSGLVVEALRGEPGVRSKRWSGMQGLSGRALDDANNELLVARLVGAGNRNAKYVCAAVYVDDEEEFGFTGETDGFILGKPRGAGGFGYDPYFFSPELGRSFGEASAEEKALVSHRGRAFARLIAHIRARR